MGTKNWVAVPPIASRFLTLEEAAIYVRHGERTLQRWISEGRLPFCRVAGGRRVLICRDDLDAFVEEGRVDPRAKGQAKESPYRAKREDSSPPTPDRQDRDRRVTKRRPS